MLSFPKNGNSEKWPGFELVQFALAGGVFLLGALGLVGFYLNIPGLRALWTAYGILFVSMALFLGLYQKKYPGFSYLRKAPMFFLLIALGISFFHIASTLIKEKFNFLKLLSVGVEGYMSFLSAVCLFFSTIGIFLYFYKPHSSKSSFFGVGFSALILVNLNIYACAGYVYNIPLLYNNKMALSASIAYFLVGIFLLIASAPQQGLFYPLLAKRREITWAVLMVIILDCLILFDGIADMVRLDSVIKASNFGHFSYLYLMSSFSSIVLSILITAIGLKAMHYYLDLKYAENTAETARAALAEMNLSLEARIEERTSELIKSYSALQEKEKQRQMFVTAITHDLKTPLIAQRRILESLREDLIGENPESFQLAQGLLDNNNNLLTMVNRVLETYQYEEGKVELKLEPIHLKSLVEACLIEIKSLLNAKDIQVINELSENLPLITGDRMQLKRVFQNLLANAISYAPLHGVISLHSAFHEQKVAIHISDNGPGIDKEILPYLFNQYLMGSKKQKIGSGLGLFICRLILEMHHGTIEVSNDPGRGALFIVTLPISM